MLGWLQAQAVTHVAMESTGVYWKPLVNLLESTELEATVVNARHIKAVPGRKTHVKHAEWIADLLRHGLLRASFIPDRPQRELRELARYRRTLIEQRSHEASGCRRCWREPTSSSVTLPLMCSASGRAMPEALVQGQSDPTTLAQLAKAGLKKKTAQLEQAPRGMVGPHQRLMLRQLLNHVDFLARQIGLLDREMAERMRPFEAAIEMLDPIAARRGKKRAQVAVAQSLLVAIYHMLKDGTMHHHLGADYFEKRDRDHLVRRAVSRLQHLGYRSRLRRSPDRDRRVFSG